MKRHDITRMEILDEEMQEAIESGDFDAYYERNIEFHRTYLRLAKNQALADTVDILKKKLYEFSRPKEFIKEWEDVSMGEHRQLVAMLKQGDFGKAADFLRNTIWSFEAQKKYIVKYYHFENKDQ
jgi:DNA-binding GntR family transcriptional regulator